MNGAETRIELDVNNLRKGGRRQPRTNRPLREENPGHPRPRVG